MGREVSGTAGGPSEAFGGSSVTRDAATKSKAYSVFLVYLIFFSVRHSPIIVHDMTSMRADDARTWSYYTDTLHLGISTCS